MKTIPGRYPNIERWMLEHHVTKAALAKMMDVGDRTVYRLFQGGNVRRPHPYTREAIQRITGMSYEEAFQEGDGA